MKRKLVFATNNAHKLEEISAISVSYTHLDSHRRKADGQTDGTPQGIYGENTVSY